MAEKTTANYRPRTEYLKQYVGLCKMISMWPREKTNPIRYWLVYLVVIFSGIFMTTAMYVQMYLLSNDIDGVTQIIDFATVYTSALFRFFHVYIYGKRYREMVEYMNENFVDESFNCRGEKLTMKKYRRKGKLISIVYAVLMKIWLLTMSLTPFVHYYIQKNTRDENGTLINPDIELKMSIDVPMPFDISQPEMAYLSYAICITSYYTMSMIYGFLDTFWFNTLVLTTGQFELIAHSIRSYSDDDEEENEENPESQLEMENVIASCLDQHSKVRKFVRIIESLMHQCVLVDFLHAVASISFILLGLSVAIYQSSPIKILNLLGYFIVSVNHMWLLDYLGNELTVKEQDLAMAIYESPWYKYPNKIKSQILLMVVLARNPFRLTGGKLYHISLEFFAATLKTIFSYFTVLLQLREAPT